MFQGKTSETWAEPDLWNIERAKDSVIFPPQKNSTALNGTMVLTNQDIKHPQIGISEANLVSNSNQNPPGRNHSKPQEARGKSPAVTFSSLMKISKEDADHDEDAGSGSSTQAQTPQAVSIMGIFQEDDTFPGMCSCNELITLVRDELAIITTPCGGVGQGPGKTSWGDLLDCPVHALGVWRAKPDLGLIPSTLVALAASKALAQGENVVLGFAHVLLGLFTLLEPAYGMFPVMRPPMLRLGADLAKTGRGIKNTKPNSPNAVPGGNTKDISTVLQEKSGLTAELIHTGIALEEEKLKRRADKENIGNLTNVIGKLKKTNIKFLSTIDELHEKVQRSQDFYGKSDLPSIHLERLPVEVSDLFHSLWAYFSFSICGEDRQTILMEMSFLLFRELIPQKYRHGESIDISYLAKKKDYIKKDIYDLALMTGKFIPIEKILNPKDLMSRIAPGKAYPRIYSIGETLRLSPLSNWKNDSYIAVPDPLVRLTGKCSSLDNFKIRTKRSPVKVVRNPTIYHTPQYPRVQNPIFKKGSFLQRVYRCYKEPLDRVRTWTVSKRARANTRIEPYEVQTDWTYQGHQIRSNPSTRIRSGLFFDQETLSQNGVGLEEIPMLDRTSNAYIPLKVDGAGASSTAVGMTTRPLRSEARSLTVGSTEHFNSNRKLTFANGQPSSYNLLDLSTDVIPSKVGRIEVKENPFRINGEIPSNDRYATLTREQRGNIDLTQPGYVLGTGERVEAPLSTNPDSVRQDFMTFEAARIQRMNDPSAIGQRSLRACSSTRGEYRLNPQQGIRTDNTAAKADYVSETLPIPKEWQEGMARRIQNDKIKYVDAKARAFSAKQEWDRLTSTTNFKPGLDEISQEQLKSFSNSFKTGENFPDIDGLQIRYEQGWTPDMSPNTGAIPKRTRPPVKRVPSDQQVSDEVSKMSMHYENLIRTEKSGKFSRKISSMNDRHVRDGDGNYELEPHIVHSNLNMGNYQRADVPAQNLYPNSLSRGSLKDTLFPKNVRDSSRTLNGLHKPRTADIQEKVAAATKIPSTYEAGLLEGKAIQSGVLYDSTRGPRIDQMRSNSLISQMTQADADHIYEKVNNLGSPHYRYVLKRPSQLAKAEAEGKRITPLPGEIEIPEELNGKGWHKPNFKLLNGQFFTSDRMKKETKQIMESEPGSMFDGQSSRRFPELAGDETNIATPNNQDEINSVKRMQWWSIVLAGGAIVSSIPGSIHAIVKGEQQGVIHEAANKEERAKFMVKEAVDFINAQHQLNIIDLMAITEEENRRNLLLQAEFANNIQILRMFKDSPSYPQETKNQFDVMDYSTLKSIDALQGVKNNDEVEKYRKRLQQAVDESIVETRAQLNSFSKSLQNGIPRSNLTYSPQGDNGVFAQELHKEVHPSRPDPIAQGYHPHLPEFDKRLHEDWLRAKGNVVLHKDDTKFGTTLPHASPYNAIESQLWRAGAKKARKDEAVLKAGARIMRKYIPNPKYHKKLPNGTVIPEFDMEGSDLYKDISSKEIAALIKANQIGARWSGGDDEMGRMQLTLNDISMKKGIPVEELIDGVLPPITYNWYGDREPILAVMPRNKLVKGLGIVDEDQPGTISQVYREEPSRVRLSPVGSERHNLQNQEFFTVVVDQSTLPISSDIPLRAQSDAYGNYWLPYYGKKTEYPKVGTIIGPDNQVKEIIKVPGPKSLVDRWAISPPYGQKIRLYERNLHGPINYSPVGTTTVIHSALSPRMIPPSSMEWNNWAIENNGAEEEVITSRIEGFGLGEESSSTPSRPVDIPPRDDVADNPFAETIEMVPLNQHGPGQHDFDDVALSDTPPDSDQFHLSLPGSSRSSTPPAPGPPDDDPDDNDDEGGYDADESGGGDEGSPDDRRVVLHGQGNRNSQMAPYISAAMQLAIAHRNSITAFFITHPNVYSGMTFGIGAFLASAATAGVGQLANHLRVNFLKGMDELINQLLSSGRDHTQKFLDELTDLGWDLFKNSGHFDSKEQMKSEFSKAGSMLMKDVEDKYQHQNHADEVGGHGADDSFNLQALNTKTGREKALRFWQFIKSDKSFLTKTAMEDETKTEIESQTPNLAKVLYRSRHKRDLSDIETIDYDDYEETEESSEDPYNSELMTEEELQEMKTVSKENEELEESIRRAAMHTLRESEGFERDMLSRIGEEGVEEQIKPIIDPKFYNKPWTEDKVFNGLISSSFISDILAKQKKRLAISRQYARKARLQRELAEKSRRIFLRRMGVELSKNNEIKGILTSSRDPEQTQRIMKLEEEIHNLKLKDIQIELQMKLEKKNKMTMYNQTIENMSILTERNVELRQQLEKTKFVLSQHQGYLNHLDSVVEIVLLNKAGLTELRSLLLRRIQDTPAQTSPASSSHN